MEESEKIIFNRLKKTVADTFLSNNKVNNPDYTTWKGQEIVLFQEDFFKKVKSGFSEKWFYSYFKAEPTKLPRIDMLNILAQYAGYQNWADFKHVRPEETIVLENQERISQPAEVIIEANNPTKTIFQKWGFRLFIGFIISVLTGISWWFYSYEVYHFSFVDDMTNTSLKNSVKITVLQPNESPFHTTSDDLGNFEWTTKEPLKMIISAPYHRSDTIIRSSPTAKTEFIKLPTDDRAMMIHYFSIENVKDWKKRRNYLSNIIDDEAVIYQIINASDTLSSVEIYNKEDFINKMTLVTKSLKNINIIDIEYSTNKKIAKLKFKTK